MSLTPDTRVGTHLQEWLKGFVSESLLRSVFLFVAGMFTGAIVALAICW